MQASVYIRRIRMTKMVGMVGRVRLSACRWRCCTAYKHATPEYGACIWKGAILSTAVHYSSSMGACETPHGVSHYDEGVNCR